MSMRQVNREVSRNVESEFIKRFFTKREHLVTVYSLRTLAAITAVPSLTARLRELRFVPRTPGKYRRPSSLLVIAERPNPDSTSDLDEFIHTILQSLSRQGVCPTLANAARSELRNEHGVALSLGSADFKQRFPRSCYLVGDATQILTLLLDNVARTAFNMTRLRVAQLPEGATQEGGHNSSPALVTSLSKLKALDLGFLHHWFRKDPRRLPEFIAAVANITELQLSSIAWGTSPRWLSQAFATHCIQSLSLQRSYCSSINLVEVIRVHQANLKRLEIFDVGIPSGDCYSPIFEYIGQSYTLEKVRLADLRVGDPYDLRTKRKSVMFGQDSDISLSGELTINYALAGMVEAGLSYKEVEEIKKIPLRTDKAGGSD